MAFWRGNTPTILIQAATSSLNFMFYDSYKKAASHLLRLSHTSESLRDERKHAMLSSFLSGGLAGGSTITIIYPLGFMRTRLAVDVGSETRMYPRGMRDVFWSTLKSDGIRGFFAGYGIALASVSLYRVVYLGGYDVTKKELVNRKSSASASPLDIANPTVQPTVYERFFAAQFVSILASITHYPLDSVRRRLMMQAGRSDRQYASALDCFGKIFYQEGIGGFYLGIGPNIVRSVGAALVLVSYDAFKSILW
uniref:ADP/ATP translocase n=1 Tax=Odontella aurita TaxID=265563 RepID=A0A6U6GBS2_9STRA|mmetsp:Transcript_390/g.1150  ORF Transcript_390/g.1150 Transcript_390/m.1150 type:complete len:252 (+) Transcript_390:663-1418(+)|eukprot:CAMPEP_0113597766 /NCGR_PEP_ID=MMETSP0015_2-20120614/41202_1 /TAXON_ID=2838 /ORGANISM="Odontella" /LENGTH=251 /DNA_ID=CAMNT_0000505685 /DNA_START=499 /DNA_END=1251 /DNA_ORIENTATION=- /assembly_acc=CAM_ASM_000160